MFYPDQVFADQRRLGYVSNEQRRTTTQRSASHQQHLYIWQKNSHPVSTRTRVLDYHFKAS